MSTHSVFSPSASHSCFGALLGTYLYWIGYSIVSGIKWIIKKLKNHKIKKEKTTNE